jgi:exonuclease SbcC
VRPVRLELEGFLSYAEPTSIEFAGVEAVAVVGENGSGKTALLEAITWALYGITRARGADDVVNDGSTVARVAFEFVVRMTRYRVVRERHSGKSGKSELRLETLEGWPEQGDAAWSPVGGDKIADTQVAIEELLGMSADLFTSTAFVGQGDADRFTELRPAARKALLFELLELGHYSDLAVLAHNEVAIHAQAIAKLEARIDTLSDGLEDPDALVARRDGAREVVDRMRSDREEIRTNIAGARELVEESRRLVAASSQAVESLAEIRGRRLRSLEDSRSRLVGLEERLARLEQQRQDVDAEIAGQSAVASRHAEVEQRATETGKTAQGAREAAEQALREHEGTKLELGRATERLLVLEDRSDLLSGGLCPTCGSSLEEDRIRELLRLIADARAAVTIAEKANEDAEEILRLRNLELRHTGDELAAATTEVQEVRAAIAGLETSTSRRAAIMDGIEEVLRDVKLHRATVRETDEPSEEEQRLERLAGGTDLRPKIEELTRELEALEDRERGLDRELEIGQATLTRLDATLEETRRRIDDVAGVQMELVEVGAQRTRYAVLEEAFGRNGIPAELLRRSIADLDRETNEILGKLTAGRYTLAIETERALRSGRAAETLDVIVSDDRSDRPLEALSGGERQAVDIALRLGLSRILAARAGHPVELLVLDETFAAFDSGRRQAAVELLGAVRERFGSIVFVTHDRALAEAFPRRLFVERVGETSRARLE